MRILTIIFALSAILSGTQAQQFRAHFLS